MQTTWKTFKDLQSARTGLRGRTAAALTLVTENLLRDETVQFVASAEVNTSFTWDDGVVVVTDQRVWAAGCDSNTGFTLGFYAELGPAVSVRELQPTGTVGRFQIAGMETVQGIGLPHATLQLVAEMLAAARGSSAPATSGAEPHDLLVPLAALRDAGILTEAEFAEKKRQILDRI